MTTRKTPAQPSPFRYTVSMRETGALADEDRLHATLNVLQSMELRLNAARPIGGASPMLALTGATAIGIATRTLQLALRPAELLVAHNTREDLRRFLSHNPSTTLERFANVRDDLLARAQFLTIPISEYGRPAMAQPSRGDGPGHAIERGTRILLHAAMRTAAVSSVCIQRAGSKYPVRVPMLSPNGVFLVAIARIGRFSAYEREIQSLVWSLPRSPKFDDQRTLAERRLRETGDAATHARMAWMSIAAATLRARNELSAAGYPEVTDRILDDPDVFTVVNAALDTLSNQVRQHSHDALADINRGAIVAEARRGADRPTAQR